MIRRVDSTGLGWGRSKIMPRRGLSSVGRPRNPNLPVDSTGLGWGLSKIRAPVCMDSPGLCWGRLKIRAPKVELRAEAKEAQSPRRFDQPSLGPVENQGPAGVELGAAAKQAEPPRGFDWP